MEIFTVNHLFIISDKIESVEYLGKLMSRKINRRKLIKVIGLGGLSVLIGKKFLSFDISRKIANALPMSIDGVDFKFKGLLKIKEYKLSARIVRKLTYIKNQVKYDKGHNTRLYSALEEYVPIGINDSANWIIDHKIPELEDSFNKNFYIRTEKPNKLTFDIDHIKLEGVQGNKSITTNEIIDKSSSLGTVMMECAGNDRFASFRLMSVASWEGVWLKDILSKDKKGNSFFGKSQIDPKATHVLIEGFDETSETKWNRLFGVESKPGASWIFSIEELVKQKAFLASKMNGKELTPDHGYPVRLVVPGYYGCASIKWVNRIKFFTPFQDHPTEEQMKEFSDRTGQVGVPQLLQDHKPPHIYLSSTLVSVEKWQSETEKKYKFLGVVWGGIHEENPKFKMILRKRSNPKIVIHESEVIMGPRNPLSFQHWEYTWDKPIKGRYLVDIVCLDENIEAPRIENHHYRRLVKIS